jgi:hypothetical protein
MMADLGLARRDLVSAPDADSKGRVMREDPRRERILAQELKERQEKIAKAPADNEKAQRLLKWNSQ